MKITINVDCTPEEARRFLGLPDVQGMQEALVEDLQKRLRAGLEAMDPEVVLKTWMPLGLQGLEKFQRMFWTEMAKAAGGPRSPGAPEADESGDDKRG